VTAVALPARGRPPQAAARRAGLECVEKLLTERNSCLVGRSGTRACFAHVRSSDRWSSWSPAWLRVVLVVAVAYCRLMDTMRSVFAVPARLVTDDAHLHQLLTQALDQLAAHARASGWRLQGAPSPFIFQPDHAAALGLDIPLPEDPDDCMALILSVDAVDELDAQLAR